MGHQERITDRLPAFLWAGSAPRRLAKSAHSGPSWEGQEAGQGATLAVPANQRRQLRRADVARSAVESQGSTAFSFNLARRWTLAPRLADRRRGLSSPVPPDRCVSEAGAYSGHDRSSCERLASA